MSEEVAVVSSKQRLSLVAAVAARYDLEPAMFLQVVKKTVFPQDREASNEQVAAFLAVCQQYDLNCFTREIFVFPTKGGGIQPIVSIDGWVKLIVGHPQFDGMEYKEILDEGGKLLGGTCTIYRKDRKEHPTAISEWFAECKRSTDPWEKMPRRMMRHKCIKEAGRVAFGFAGIQDEDEGLDAIKNVTGESVVLERTTNAATETLKDKIGAKKAGKKTDQTTEQTAPTPPAAPEPPKAAETPAPTPPAQPGPDQAQSQGQEELFPTGTDPNIAITEEQRIEFLGIIQAKVKTEEQKQFAQKACRKALFDRGYTNTKEILVKDLEPLKKWARELEVK